MIDAVLAIFFGTIGTIVLFYSQRVKPLAGFLKRVLIGSGWGLLLVSLYFWVKLADIEYGVAYGFMVPALFAWGVIWFFSDIKKPVIDRLKIFDANFPSQKKLLLSFSYCLFIVPFLAVASTIIAVFMSYLLPMKEVNQLSLCIFIQFILWVAFSLWFFMAARRLKVFSIVLFVTILSSLFLFI